MSRLKTVEEGAFENLPALRHFSCRSNTHLNSIHPHAFANPDVELQPHVEWPPIQSVSNVPIQLNKKQFTIDDFDEFI